MAEHKIPSKQLHRAGSKTELQNHLSDREIGYCIDDGKCYIKYGSQLVSVSSNPEMTEQEVEDLVNSLN